MARIAGVDLPREKQIQISLQYLYGVGITTAKKICATAQLDPTKRTKDLTEEELHRIREELEKSYKVGAITEQERTELTQRLTGQQPPVLVEVSHGEVGVIGLPDVRSVVDNYQAGYGVETHINLDRSPSVEAPSPASTRALSSSTSTTASPSPIIPAPSTTAPSSRISRWTT